MEEKKVLDFIEKMYIEFTALFEQIDKRFEQIDKRFEQMDKRFEQMDKRFEQMDKRFDQVESRLTKLEFGQERLEDRVDEVFEALQSHIEVNDRQHEEIMMELKGDISLIKTTIKRIVK
ncbi:MAG: hypothetical protein ACOYVD_02470 [Bacillota bacterium]